MYFLNRVYMIGRVTENPNIFLEGNSERVAILRLNTQWDQDATPHIHTVFIEDPLMVEYAHSCLTAEDLVFVEGRLEPITGDSGLYQENWIVISKECGLLHPVYSGAQVFQKGSRLKS